MCEREIPVFSATKYLALLYALHQTFCHWDIWKCHDNSGNWKHQNIQIKHLYDSVCPAKYWQMTEVEGTHFCLHFDNLQEWWPSGFSAFVSNLWSQGWVCLSVDLAKQPTSKQGHRLLIAMQDNLSCYNLLCTKHHKDSMIFQVDESIHTRGVSSSMNSLVYQVYSF